MQLNPEMPRDFSTQFIKEDKQVAITRYVNLTQVKPAIGQNYHITRTIGRGNQESVFGELVTLLYTVGRDIKLQSFSKAIEFS